MNSATNRITKSLICLSLLSAGSVPGYAQTGSTCTYSQMASITAGNRTAHVVAVDLNKDGVPDIVGSNQGGTDKGTITVALSTGKGKFGAPVNYTLGDVGPYETAAADFNSDGYPDLVVELFGTAGREVIGKEVDVFINKGDGTFKPFVAYASGDKPRGVAAGDLNKDGKADILVANSHENTVGVLLNKGDGTFGPRVDYPAGGNPHGAVVADFNKDGNPDVALCNNGPKGAINVLLGKGDGTLLPTTEYIVGAGAFGQDAGDLNNDGYSDIVSAGNRASSVSVLINNGNGTFKPVVDYTITANPVDVAVGDLNGDGRMDVLAASGKGTDILMGKGDGTFQPTVLVETGSSYCNVAADFDLDGSMDFATAVTSGQVVIMKGTCK
jgi:hypothetical protein